MPKVAIIYGSGLGRTKQMAEAIANGVKTIEGVDVVLTDAYDTVLEDIKDADALIEIARFLDSHVNLIQYNPIDSSDFKPGNILLINTRLSQAKVNVTIRKSFGAEIKAACGQLAGKASG